MSEREIEVVGRSVPPPLPAWALPAVEAEDVSLSPLAVDEPVIALITRRPPAPAPPRRWLGLVVAATVVVNAGTTLALRGSAEPARPALSAGAKEVLALPLPAEVVVAPVPPETLSLPRPTAAVLGFTNEDAIAIAAASRPPAAARPPRAQPAPAPRAPDAGPTTEVVTAPPASSAGDEHVVDPD